MGVKPILADETSGIVESRSCQLLSQMLEGFFAFYLFSLHFRRVYSFWGKQFGHSAKLYLPPFGSLEGNLLCCFLFLPLPLPFLSLSLRDI